MTTAVSSIKTQSGYVVDDGRVTVVSPILDLKALTYSSCWALALVKEMGSAGSTEERAFARDGETSRVNAMVYDLFLLALKHLKMELLRRW